MTALFVLLTVAGGAGFVLSVFGLVRGATTENSMLITTSAIVLFMGGFLGLAYLGKLNLMPPEEQERRKKLIESFHKKD